MGGGRAGGATASRPLRFPGGAGAPSGRVDFCDSRQRHLRAADAVTRTQLGRQPPPAAPPLCCSVAAVGPPWRYALREGAAADARGPGARTPPPPPTTDGGVAAHAAAAAAGSTATAIGRSTPRAQRTRTQHGLLPVRGCGWRVARPALTPARGAACAPRWVRRPRAPPAPAVAHARRRPRMRPSLPTGG